jgi:hypothetical protein
MPLNDPHALLEQLDPAVIRTRIAELDRERAALVILLRAADARKRAPRPDRGGAEEVQQGAS